MHTLQLWARFECVLHFHVPANSCSSGSVVDSDKSLPALHGSRVGIQIDEVYFADHPR